MDTQANGHHHEHVSPPISISRVRRDGQVERLGQWLHDERVLELEREGFPFLGPGRHQLEGELPWIFWDMCPSGYLGRRLQSRMPALRLADNPRDWMAADVLRALSLAGGDLAGNLLIGDEAVTTFRDVLFDSTDFASAFEAAMRDSVLTGSPSSLGGERPKVLWSDGDSAQLAKFAPPPGSPQGQRWSDLLRMEALCSTTLRLSGVSAVVSEARENLGRTMLFVERFDRLPNRGRVGVGTLFWLAMDRWGDVALSAPEVMARLNTEGLVDANSVEVCTKVHAFSAAIGNNDAHLGNYGLLFDDAGRATLAPIYDVLPMALAPSNDELPDAWLTPRTAPVAPSIAPWVDALVRAVQADAEISGDFKALWRHHIGV
ncbi:MAG: HipA domain-containing protein [Archangium sp.]|nr:HipA domain-containing protein [Archangium sp.]